ncbi:LacI family transcriptional regulator [Kribbella voronezhensis]|uniref:LacI family transcriptional regulator n=2 Tax=Kribbella voronezhensis TaxID=2512212 RepID=A0A4R7T801_9ACTN|nr:LacI family transcriptional regulator [Kribbella voronezhensis]
MVKGSIGNTADMTTTLTHSGGGAERPARSTMKDVAALAGVSVKTVSRVVNGEPGASPAVRERILQAAERLDYRHNLGASTLRRKGARSGIVGALLQDVGNSFSAGLLRALEDVLRGAGLSVLAASLDEEPERERGIVSDLVARRADGLVLMPASDRHEYLLSEHRAGLPLVFVDRRPHGLDCDSVTVDNRLGAKLATAHLVAGGHRRIAMLSDLQQIETAKDRIDGYRAALVEAGIDFDPDLLVHSVRSEEEATRVVAGLLERPDPPTALVTGRNIITVGAVRALRSAGVIGKVALVGYDDFPLADLVEPALTVIRQDVRRIGTEVGQILLDRLGGDSGPPRRVVLEPALVIRGSGEIPPPVRR